MITFSCGNCGRRLRVPESYGGRKGKCPKCGRTMTIPETQKVADLLNPPAQAGAEQFGGRPPLTFLDTPLKAEAATEPAGQPDEFAEPLPYTDAPLLGSRRSEPEPPPERKLPWFIDIFLFPVSLLSVAILVLCLAVPPTVCIMLVASGSFILITFWFGLITVMLLYVYAFWYFSASVRQSAEGQLRAPNSVIDAPGLWEMFWQFFRAIMCLLFFFLPMMIYLGHTQSFDTIFWVLFGLGVFLFPMGLLAITVLDSLSGLNPVFLIGSILSTLVPYCPLVAIYFGLGWMLTRIGSVWLKSKILAYVCIAGFYYLLLVAGHLLGRFYFRYQEKLNWDV